MALDAGWTALSAVDVQSQHYHLSLYISNKLMAKGFGDSGTFHASGRGTRNRLPDTTRRRVEIEQHIRAKGAGRAIHHPTRGDRAVEKV
jgi:hypothetical protein